MRLKGLEGLVYLKNAIEFKKQRQDNLLTNDQPIH